MIQTLIFFSVEGKKDDQLTFMYWHMVIKIMDTGTTGIARRKGKAKNLEKTINLENN